MLSDLHIEQDQAETQAKRKEGQVPLRQEEAAPWLRQSRQQASDKVFRSLALESAVAAVHARDARR